MEYIINKRMIAELANKGCKKNVINQMYEKSKEQYYFTNKLNLIIPFQDKPPLAKLTKEGELAELYKLEELGYRNRILSKSDKKKKEYYKEFSNDIPLNKDIIIFSDNNMEKFKKRIEEGSIQGKDFKINYTDIKSKEVLKNMFLEIANPNICDYLYQFEFSVSNTFFYTLVKESLELEFYKNFNFHFTDFRPDLIRILNRDEKVKVLDKDLKTIEGKPNKIKLQLCDIKMSDFSNTYYLELGLYMMVLNDFIFKNELDDIYEVVSTAVIYPQKNNESLSERENRIVCEDYELEQWVAEFDSLRHSLTHIFIKELPEIVKVIEEGNSEEYLDVKINSKCQTCDYYGGQYSEFLKERIKSKNNIEKSKNSDYVEQNIEDYLKDPKNHFCRYYMKYINNINILPNLKNGEKNILLEKDIKFLNQLEEEIRNNSYGVFDSNITLRANKNKINDELKLRGEKQNYKFVSGSSLNMPSFSNLTIYIDLKKDSQGRTIALALSHSFYAKVEDGSELKENSFKSPYIDIIEKYTANNEKKSTLDFLIKMNQILSKYEKLKTLYGRAATFSIVYWGEEVISHLEDLFIKVMKYITSKGDGIAEVYEHLDSNEEILSKKKDIEKVLYRFNSFFTADDEFKDYRVVETSPFFNMKKCVEEVVAIDVDYNYTLTEVYNKLFGENFGNYYCKPDSDQFDAGVADKLWTQKWKIDVEKKGYVHTIWKVIASRLSYMINIKFKLDEAKNFKQIDIKGVAPDIPLLARKKMFNSKIGNDLYFFHKLDSAYSLVEKERVHNQDVYSKTVLGKCLYLLNEITGKEKEDYFNNYFEGNPISNYKLYKLAEDSKNANYEENSFGLTIYPEDKSEFIYKKFFSNPQYAQNHILFSEESDIAYIKYLNNKIYKDIIGVAIKKLDRINGYIIIELSKEVNDIIKFLEEEYEFDYSKNLVIESTHTDVWEKNLKEALKRVETLPEAINILKGLEIKDINNYSKSCIKKVFREIYKNKDVPLDDSQVEAIIDILNRNFTLLWGPPGTGKSHTIAHALLLLYVLCILEEKHKSMKIILMGNYDSTDNIIGSFIELIDKFNEEQWFSNKDLSIVRIKAKNRPNGNFKEVDGLNLIEFEASNKNSEKFKEGQKRILKQNSKFQIFTATPSQISKVFVSKLTRKFSFDYVIVDEASQVDVGYFIPGLIKISENTQILLAGDNLQLPPVQKAKIKNPEENYFGSVFDYYRNEFFKDNENISKLYYNRRSNRAIVDFAKFAFDYPDKYIADESNRNQTIVFYKNLDLNEFYDDVLDPNKPIVLLSYNDGYSQKKNDFEANEIIKIVKNIYEKKLLDKAGKIYSIFDFFDKGIGIVAPHRAQKAKIQHELLKYFDSYINNLPELRERELLKQKIMSSVDTVEKYQGQQREIMICSYVLGDRDIIKEEEEFIYNSNRLNVIISRARFKAIILASKELLLNIGDDIEIVEEQKSFQKLITYCDNQKKILQKDWYEKDGIMKYKLLN